MIPRFEMCNSCKQRQAERTKAVRRISSLSYYRKNKKKLRLYRNAWDKKNRTKRNAYHRAYYKKNRAKLLDYRVAYDKKNRARINAYHRTYSKKRRAMRGTE